MERGERPSPRLRSTASSGSGRAERGVVGQKASESLSRGEILGGPFLQNEGLRQKLMSRCPFSSRLVLEDVVLPVFVPSDSGSSSSRADGLSGSRINAFLGNDDTAGQSVCSCTGQPGTILLVRPQGWYLRAPWHPQVRQAALWGTRDCFAQGKLLRGIQP